MKVGDLVKMDFEGSMVARVVGGGDPDMWGVGIIVTVEDRNPDDVEVLWSRLGLGWEMKIMLEVISEGG
jgi:hypothetical protein